MWTTRKTTVKTSEPNSVNPGILNKKFIQNKLILKFYKQTFPSVSKWLFDINKNNGKKNEIIEW